MKNPFLFLLLVVLAVLPAHGQAVRVKEKLTISITGVPTSEQGRINSVYPVSGDGFINMWMIGRVKAAGLSKAELARKIASSYRAAEIYTNPVFQVVSANDAAAQDKQTITIGGQVRSAGQRQWTEGLTLYAAVQSAGGETPYGAINRVKLYRKGEMSVYNLKNARDKAVKVYPLDTIEVPQKNFIGN